MKSNKEKVAHLGLPTLGQRHSGSLQCLADLKCTLGNHAELLHAPEYVVSDEHPQPCHPEDDEVVPDGLSLADVAL